MPKIPNPYFTLRETFIEDASRYCLEMICADFLAGANLENGDASVLLLSLDRLFQLLPGPQKEQFLATLQKAS